MSPKKKIIISSVIFGIVAIALVGFVIYPLFKGIKKNSQDFILARRELTLFQDRGGEIEQLKEIYKALEPDLERIDKFFVNPAAPLDLIDFTKFLKKTAKDSEFLIPSDNISVVPVEALETDPWNSMGFQIALAGSFPNFLKFLEKIETAPSHLIEVQSLVVNKLTEGDVDITLLIKVYTQ